MESPGFYIDIGAFDPEIHSVTKWFYENGWTGINIEPVLEYYHSFKLHRDRDLNLNTAISTQSGPVDLFVIESTGLSTLNKEISQLHTNYGLKPKTRKVIGDTLESVLAHNLDPNREIHFLKVDTEGSEKDILSNNDWKNFRPWIVIVESIVPILETKVPKADKFDFEKVGYSLAYFDGLNDFYVRNDKFEELRDRFYPPCVLDRFRRVDELDAESQAKEEDEGVVHTLRTQFQSSRLDRLDLSMRATYLNRKLETQQQEVAELESENQRMTRDLGALREELEASRQNVKDIVESKSWRITEPLRLTLQSLKMVLHRLESASFRLLSIAASQLTGTRIGRAFLNLGSKLLPKGFISRVAAETTKKKLNRVEVVGYEDRHEKELAERMQERIEFWGDKTQQV